MEGCQDGWELEHLACEEKLRELVFFQSGEEGKANSSCKALALKRQSQAFHGGAWCEDEGQLTKFAMKSSGKI